MILLSFILVFIFILIIDLLGHKISKRRRSLPGWVFLCLLLAGLVFLCMTAVSSTVRQGGYNARSIYLTYRYLEEEEPAMAAEVLDEDRSLSSADKELAEILIDASLGDALSVQTKTAALAKQDSFSAIQKALLEELADWAEKYLASESSSDLEESNRQLNLLIEESKEICSVTETDSLKEYFDIDQKIREGNSFEITDDEMEKLLADWGNDETTRKLIVRVCIEQGNTEKAVSLVKEVVKANTSSENRNLLANLLLAEGKKDPGQISNYLQSKEILSDDETGAYELELILCALFENDYDTAAEKLYRLSMDAGSLSEESSVRTDLLSIREIMQTSSIDDMDAQIMQLSENLVDDQIDSCLGSSGDQLRESLIPSIYALIKYYTPSLYIRGVNTSAYPQVTVSMNSNFKRYGLLGLGSEFYQDDFAITDNGTEAQKLDLISNGDSSIAIAVCIEAGQLSVQGDVPSVIFEDFLSAHEGEIFTDTGKALDYLKDSKASVKIILFAQALGEQYEELTSNKVYDSLIKDLGIRIYGAGTVDCGESIKAYLTNNGGNWFHLEDIREIPVLYSFLYSYHENEYVFTYTIEEDFTEDHLLDVSIPAEEIAVEAEYAIEKTGDSYVATLQKTIKKSADFDGGDSAETDSNETKTAETSIAETERVSTQIGSLWLRSDSLEHTEEAMWTLKGNVEINGFLYAGDTVSVTVSDPEAVETVKNHRTYLGDNGTITGEDGISIEFSDDSEEHNSAYFEQYLAGYQYDLAEDSFVIAVNKTNARVTGEILLEIPGVSVSNIYTDVSSGMYLSGGNLWVTTSFVQILSDSCTAADSSWKLSLSDDDLKFTGDLTGYFENPLSAETGGISTAVFHIDTESADVITLPVSESYVFDMNFFSDSLEGSLGTITETVSLSKRVFRTLTKWVLSGVQMQNVKCEMPDEGGFKLSGTTKEDLQLFDNTMTGEKQVDATYRNGWRSMIFTVDGSVTNSRLAEPVTGVCTITVTANQDCSVYTVLLSADTAELRYSYGSDGNILTITNGNTDQNGLTNTANDNSIYTGGMSGAAQSVDLSVLYPVPENKERLSKKNNIEATKDAASDSDENTSVSDENTSVSEEDNSGSDEYNSESDQKSVYEERQELLKMINQFIPAVLLGVVLLLLEIMILKYEKKKRRRKK